MPAPDVLNDARLAVLQLAAEHRLQGLKVDHLDRIASKLDVMIQNWHSDGARSAVLNYYRRQR